VIASQEKCSAAWAIRQVGVSLCRLALAGAFVEFCQPRRLLLEMLDAGLPSRFALLGGVIRCRQCGARSLSQVACELRIFLLELAGNGQVFVGSEWIPGLAKSSGLAEESIRVIEVGQPKAAFDGDCIFLCLDSGTMLVVDELIEGEVIHGWERWYFGFGSGGNTETGQGSERGGGSALPSKELLESLHRWARSSSRLARRA
jgi:hypothetical protein